jgi:hypothetical protein
MALLAALKESFQDAINSRRPGPKQFLFTEEECIILRDACVEERQRLRAHKENS